MDKYQQNLIASDGDHFRALIGPDGGSESLEDIHPWPADAIEVVQNEDYHKTKYTILILAKTVSGIAAFRNGKWEEIQPVKDDEFAREHQGVLQFKIPLDFEDRLSKIRLSFKNALADDLEIAVNYKEADKVAFDAKTDKEKIDKLVAAMEIKTATGGSVINVYFKPATPEFQSCQVELYTTVRPDGNQKGMLPETFSSYGPGWNVMLMGKYKVQEGVFFQSFPGLAYGIYALKVTQFDKTGKEIITSPFILVSLSRPKTPQGDGRCTVYI